MYIERYTYIYPPPCLWHESVSNLGFERLGFWASKLLGLFWLLGVLGHFWPPGLLGLLAVVLWASGAPGCGLVGTLLGPHNPRTRILAWACVTFSDLFFDDLFGIVFYLQKRPLGAQSDRK